MKFYKNYIWIDWIILSWLIAFLLFSFIFYNNDLLFKHNIPIIIYLVVWSILLIIKGLIVKKKK